MTTMDAGCRLYVEFPADRCLNGQAGGTEWWVRKVTLPLQFVRVAMRAESLRWWKRGEEGQLMAGGRAGSRQAGRQAGRQGFAGRKRDGDDGTTARHFRKHF